MRKSRIIFWIISLVICSIFIIIHKKSENKIPYEQKEITYAYCNNSLIQKELKKVIEDSSFGNNHRVVFTGDKSKAEIALTDQYDKGYKKVRYSPLVIAFDTESYKSYKKNKYFSTINSSYRINFKKVINSTLEGKWKDKIYCPELDTVEGKLFFDFLLSTINDGSYPNEKNMDKCVQKANQFLESNIVIQTDSLQRLKNKKCAEKELYVIFENDINSMDDEDYDFDISYPKDTIVHTWYIKYQGNNIKEIKKVMNKEGVFSNKGLDAVFDGYRSEDNSDAPQTNNFHESNGFSYVKIPEVKE